MGISVDEAAFHTSALATAEFLGRQKPGATAYVIGGAGLTHTLYSVGFTLTEQPGLRRRRRDPQLCYEKIESAVRLILKGARLIATNPDLTGRTELGITPACGALVAPIELATGKKALLRRQAQPADDVDRPRDPSDGPAEAFMVGDRMDTDIIAGTEAGMTTILVLSGVTTRELIETYPYRPTNIFEDVGHIPVAKEQSRYNFPVFLRYDNRHLALGSASRRAL